MMYLCTVCPLRPATDDAMPRARYQAVVDLAWFRPAVTHLFADLADVTSARLSYTSAHNDLHILEYVMTSLSRTTTDHVTRN